MHVRIVTDIVAATMFQLADISQALSLAVVEKVFKVTTESADTVEEIIVRRAAPVGEGLIGAVYRVQVTGKQFNKSFIAKALVSDVLLRKSLNCPMFFRREVLFFSEILPTLMKIQNKLGAKESIQRCIPICFELHCDGFNDYLILEDLTEKGYQSVPKNPNVRERNAILKSMAHFHAVSMALRVTEPDIFMKISDKLQEIYYYENNREWYEEYFHGAIRYNVAALAEYENPQTSLYYKKFIELVTDAYTQIMNLVSERGEHPVFCHGDSWCSNFFYSNDRAVIIDFQILRCASPVTDLSYFLLVSNSCRNKNDFNHAIDVYYSALQYYLLDMKLDANQIFPRSSLGQELKKYGRYGILASLSSFSLLASERCDTLKSYEAKHEEYERVPLEKIWRLTPFQAEEDKMQLVNAVHIAVDVGLI